MTLSPAIEATEEIIEKPFADSLEQLLAGIAYIDIRVRWAVVRARSHGLDPDDEFRGLYISEDQVDHLLGYEIGSNLWTKPNGQLISGDQWLAAIIAERRRRPRAE